jgi:hypothetical protein
LEESTHHMSFFISTSVKFQVAIYSANCSTPTVLSLSRGWTRGANVTACN